MTAIDDPGFIPDVCPSVIAALQLGRQGFIRELASLVTGDTTYAAPASFALVAEDSVGDVVGAIACGPPYSVIAQCVEAVSASEAQKIEIQGLIGVSKLVGVAVRDDLRGRSVGTELVWAAQQVLHQCGTYMRFYGNCASEVAPFCKRLGFTVEPQEQPLNLRVVFGVPLNISSPGMHMCSVESSLKGCVKSLLALKVISTFELGMGASS